MIIGLLRHKIAFAFACFLAHATVSIDAFVIACSGGAMRVAECPAVAVNVAVAVPVLPRHRFCLAAATANTHSGLTTVWTVSPGFPS